MSGPCKDLLSRRTALGLVGGGLASAATLGLSKPARAATTIRLGVIKVTHWAATFLIPTYMPADTKVELIEFKTSLEIIAALTAGSLDAGTNGYTQFTRMLDQGYDAKAIAGVSGGGSRFIIRKGVKVKKWSDLKGKTVAAARGSTQDVQLQLALKKHGMSVDDISYRDVGNMAVALSAMEQGQVDAAAVWEPFASQMLLNDIGTQFSTLYGDSFWVNGLLFARGEFAAKNPDAMVQLVGALIKSTDFLKKNFDKYVDLGVTLTGLPRQTIEMANKNSFPEYKLLMRDEREVANGVFGLGYTKTNVVPKLDAAFNYSYLEEATSKSKHDLGYS